MALDYRSLSRGELVRLLEMRDRRQRNQAHARIEANETERYRNLMEQAADGIFIADEQGIYLEANESGARMLGLSAAEIIGRHIRDFVVAEDIPALEADMAVLRRRKVYRNERRLRRKDGSIILVEVSVKKLSDGRIQGILRDITLRRQAEEALRQSEERFRSLTAAAFEGICISENGRILDVNDPFTAMFGYERDELVGREIVTLVAPPWRPIIAERIRTEQEELVEHQLLRKDGSQFQAEAQSKKISWRGRTVRVTALRDVTEQIRAQLALRESEEKFSKAFRASPDGLAISELETGCYIEVNEGYCQLYGYRREEMLGHTSLELGIWDNPKDRALLVNGLKTTGIVRNLEMRTRTRNGELRIILVSAESIELAGKACLVSVLHDVTDHIQAEAALRESEEKYSKVFRNSPDAVTITRLADGRIIETNEGFRRVFGHSPEAAVGRTSLELQLWGNPADRDRALQELQQTGLVRDWELSFRTRAGKMGVGLFSAEKIEIQGEPCLVTVVRDITQRKQAEAERADAVLREQLARAEYTLQLIASQEAERARIAAELHDSLGQNLLLIKNRAQLALAGKNLPADLREQLGGISQLASQSINEARQISHDLHPQQLDHLGLTRALEAMIDSAAESSGMIFQRKLDNVDGLFPKDAAMNLYRVVQESLNNILKHSRARQVRIRLERDVHEVQLHIEDDGCGFNITGPVNGEKGLGLKNIAERVRILGGKLNVESQPGKGTRIEVSIPVADGA